MITNKGRTVAGVRYEMVFRGEVLNIVSTGDKVRISDLVAQADRNPGMNIFATIYKMPGVGTEPDEILSRRRVYPVD